jgi:HlyD family secretion protein
MKRPLFTIVIILLLGGGVGWWIWQQNTSRSAAKTIKASGTIETTDIQVGSRVGGRVLGVYAKEGDNVTAGQVLVSLDPYQVPEQKAALEAQLAQAQAELDQLIRGPRPQEIAQARAQARAAEAQASLQRAGSRSEEIAQATATRRQAEVRFNNELSNYRRFQELLSRDVVSEQEFQDVRTRYESAQQDLNVARQRELELRQGNRPQEIAAAEQQAKAQLENLRLLEAGTRPEQITAQRARIGNIQAQIREMDQTEKELKIRASCACQVNSLDLRPGQLLTPNQTVISLFNLNDLWVRVYIPEETFGRVLIGDPAEVRVDAYPEKTFRGRVVQLASQAEFTPRNIQTPETRRIQVFGVKTALDNREHLLRPGMTADVTFTLSPAGEKSP